MSILYSDTPQGSDLWLDERAGLLTASNAKKMMAKDGGTGLASFIRDLAMQRVYGRDDTAVSFKSAAMQRGNDLEEDARNAFIFLTDLDAAEVGLATNTDYPGAGASLDGLISTNVGLEIKCVGYDNMRKWADEDRLPLDYRHQVVFQMMVCELEHVHFWAWHPKTTPYHINVVRDDDACHAMAERYREINARIELQAERERTRNARV
jgi:putative phage-type endonuclease